MKELIACKYAPIYTVDDPLSMIGTIFWRWAEPDRFGKLNSGSPYNFKVREDMVLPTFKTPKETMEELCLKRAEELKKEYGNKQIVLLWSGGVDSTCILCSLLTVGLKPIVLCTRESIQEAPSIYDFLNKNGVRFEIFSWLERSKIYHKVFDKYGEVVYILGWCADQLFGSNVNLNYPHLYTTDYKYGFKEILKDRRVWNELPESKIDENIELFGEYAKEIGIPIEYTCEGLWLYNFAVKWSHVSLDFKLVLPKDEYRKYVINFFEDVRFQNWAVANYKEFHKHNQTLDVANYKRPLKNVIFDYTKDEDYLLNKGKVNSWKNRDIKAIQTSDLCILDDDGFHMFDLMIPTEYSNYFLMQLNRQEANRRYYLKDYLKEGVDVERFLFMEEQ